MNNIKNKVEVVFQEIKMKYEYNNNNDLFISKINMMNELGILKILVRVKKDCFTVYSILDIKIDQKDINKVSEYLHRANCGLQNGNFELDYDSGTVLFKVHVNCKKLDISKEVIMESIFTSVFMFDLYGENLLQVISESITPKEGIIESEKRKEKSK